MKQNRLCSTCKTGEENYKLDPTSETCRYICCYKNGKCAYYKPIENKEKCFFTKLFGKK